MISEQSVNREESPKSWELTVVWDAGGGTVERSRPREKRSCWVQVVVLITLSPVIQLELERKEC